MSFRRVSAPECLPVELTDARENLRVDGEELDRQITIWVQGITAALEHEIGQCVMKQGWQGEFARFDQCITLPHPAITVTKIEYVDPSGQKQELDPARTRIVRKRYSSALQLATGEWPMTDGRDGSVVISLECGYGDAPETTPENIRLYVLAKLVDQFDPVTQAEKGTRQSVYVDRLLDACRSYA